MAYYNPYYYAQYPYNGYQSFATNSFKSMEWVDGEVGAKAFQRPDWLPINTPIALWDSSEKKIYLKSWNNMGMANPMQELDYTIKENANPALLPENISGEMHEQYITKNDFEKFKKDITNLIKQRNDSNRSENK